MHPESGVAGDERAPAIALARSSSALFLDVDGTLLDLASTPDTVVVPADLARDLDRLAQRLGGALAILSGRSIADIDRLFSPLRVVIAGQHGAELRTVSPGGSVRRVGAASTVPDAWPAQLAALALAHPGVLIEHKGGSIAAHFRNAPQAGPELEATMRRLAETDPRFILQLGHCVAELKPRGASKGAALLEIMRLPAFRSRTPVMVGDDLTDEDAFLAASFLGGHALRVGPRRGASEPGFATPAEVRRWLKLAVDR